MRSFEKIKPLQNGENSFSFTDVSKSCRSRKSFTCQTFVANMSLNSILENKILAKIFEFTVVWLCVCRCLQHVAVLVVNKCIQVLHIDTSSAFKKVEVYQFGGKMMKK